MKICIASFVNLLSGLFPQSAYFRFQDITTGNAVIIDAETFSVQKLLLLYTALKIKPTQSFNL